MKSLQWTRLDRNARERNLGAKVELAFDDYNTPHTRVLDPVAAVLMKLRILINLAFSPQPFAKRIPIPATHFIE